MVQFCDKSDQIFEKYRKLKIKSHNIMNFYSKLLFQQSPSNQDEPPHLRDTNLRANQMVVSMQRRHQIHSLPRCLLLHGVGYQPNVTFSSFLVLFLCQTTSVRLEK
jgi:hypothetical protein